MWLEDLELHDTYPCEIPHDLPSHHPMPGVKATGVFLFPHRIYSQLANHCWIHHAQQWVYSLLHRVSINQLLCLAVRLPHPRPPHHPYHYES